MHPYLCNSCVDGYYQDGSSCSPCYYTCRTCSGPLSASASALHQNCLSCYEDRTYRNDIGFCMCKSGATDDGVH